MKQIVIMPGGFHPFHAGHAALYKSAVEAFPNADVYVAATNDTKTRPFPFNIKEKLAKLAGVAPGHFVQVKSPFKSEEITSHYNPNEDVLIFVRSEKDRTEQPKPGGTKKDGTPAYFQPYTGKNLQPFSKHAYIAYLPTVEFGPGIKSATEIRNAWPKLDDRRKTAMVMSLYPVTQKNPKLAANVVKMLDMGMGEQVNEFAPGGDFKPPVPPKQKGNDPWGNDDRSKILQAVKQLLAAGNKVDWKVPGQMGHVVRVNDDAVTMKRWGKPYSKIHYSLMLTDDQDDQYQILMVKPGYYKVVSSDPQWNLEEQEDVAEGSKNIEVGDKITWWYNKFHPNYEGIVRELIGPYIIVYAPGSGQLYQLTKDDIRSHNKKDINEGPYVQRIMHPGKVSIYLRLGKGSKLVATDIPYEILDKYIQKVIQKYPQFKPDDFSFRATDKITKEGNEDYLNEE